MRVSIIGQGYVGLTIAAGAASAGHQVIGFDINVNRVFELQNGIDKTLESNKEQFKHGIL